MPQADAAYFQHRLDVAGRGYTNILPLVDFRDKRVLEIGCGDGNRCVYFNVLGAKAVVGIDIGWRVWNAPQMLADYPHNGAIVYTAANGERLPFPDASFDIIVLDNTMEHIVAPAAVLDEAQRVMRAGAVIVIIMPHYYGLSGSHLWNFIPRQFLQFPHPYLWLPRPVLHRIVQGMGKRRGYDPQRIDDEWQQYVTLGRLRLGKLFTLLNERFSVELKVIRRSRLPLKRLWSIPVIEELFSWGIEVVARK